MGHKWSFFAIGVLAGIVAVLAYALILQANEPKVSAAAAAQDSNPQMGMLISTGGSQQNLNDIVWVIYKRQSAKKAEEGTGTMDSVLHKDEQISLACYQVANNGRGMKFVGVRNISWDMDLIELNNEKPSVIEIIKALREEAKKKKNP